MGRIPLLLRLGVVGAWAVLFAALLSRDVFVESVRVRETGVLERSRRENFFGVYFNNRRIGYVEDRYLPADNGGVRLEQSAYLVLNVLGARQPVTMRSEAELSGRQELRGFFFQLESPFSRMKASGRVQDAEILVTMDSGKETRELRLPLRETPFFATGRRGYLLKDLPQEDDRFRIPYFDPLTLAVRESVIQYKGRDKVVIHGRVHNLHHFVETFSGVRVESWLNDEGEVVQEKSPAGFVFLAEPEFLAKSLDRDPGEILSAVSIPMSDWDPAFASAAVLRYRLTLPEDVRFDLDADRQRLDGDVLEVTRETWPASEVPACQGMERWLESSAYVQSDHAEIGAAVDEVARPADSAGTQVRQLAEWVHAQVEKKPVIGLPDALETLRNRVGDCNEHAALFAALARNAGIPTRIVAGVMFQGQAFYYHAWNEVCLGDRWYSLDTTRNQRPADITHIKFVEGETEEQVRIGGLLGRLKIEIAR